MGYKKVRLNTPTFLSPLAFAPRYDYRIDIRRGFSGDEASIDLTFRKASNPDVEYRTSSYNQNDFIYEDLELAGGTTLYFHIRTVGSIKKGSSPK